MTWPFIVSIVLNALGILVWLKVPEFLQSYIIKKVEFNYEEKMQEVNQKFQKDLMKLDYDFQSKLDTLKKHYEVLPELFRILGSIGNEILEFEISNHIEGKDRIEKAEQFIFANQFYIDEEIFEQSSNFLVSLKKVTNLDTQAREGDENYYSTRIVLTDECNEKLTELETMIRTAMKS